MRLLKVATDFGCGISEKNSDYVLIFDFSRTRCNFVRESITLTTYTPGRINMSVPLTSSMQAAVKRERELSHENKAVYEILCSRLALQKQQLMHRHYQEGQEMEKQHEKTLKEFFKQATYYPTKVVDTATLMPGLTDNSVCTVDTKQPVVQEHDDPKKRKIGELTTAKEASPPSYAEATVNPSAWTSKDLPWLNSELMRFESMYTNEHMHASLEVQKETYAMIMNLRQEIDRLTPVQHIHPPRLTYPSSSAMEYSQHARYGKPKL